MQQSVSDETCGFYKPSMNGMDQVPMMPMQYVQTNMCNTAPQMTPQMNQMMMPDNMMTMCMPGFPIPFQQGLPVYPGTPTSAMQSASVMLTAPPNGVQACMVPMVTAAAN
jgi:hypothetical protein